MTGAVLKLVALWVGSLSTGAKQTKHGKPRQMFALQTRMHPISQHRLLACTDTLSLLRGRIRKDIVQKQAYLTEARLEGANALHTPATCARKKPT
eukprot:1946382-Rhodomonas_salina.1